MSWHSAIPLLVVASSLVPGLIIFFLPESQRPWRTFLNLAGAVSKLVFVGIMLWGVSRQQEFETRIPVLPDFELVLTAGPLALLFVSLSAVLWLVTTIYAIGFLEGSPHRSRFFGFFGLCVTSTVGVALAGNLLTFILFYEMLTLSTYPLVIHKGTEKAPPGRADLPCLHPVRRRCIAAGRHLALSADRHPGVYSPGFC